MDVGAQSSEIKTLQRRLDLLSRKEARLQVSQNYSRFRPRKFYCSDRVLGSMIVAQSGLIDSFYRRVI